MVAIAIQNPNDQLTTLTQRQTKNLTTIHSFSEAINSAMKSVKDQLGETGRVILRPSGTEPLIRVTLEGIDEVQVNRLATELADVVRAEFG